MRDRGRFGHRGAWHRNRLSIEDGDTANYRLVTGSIDVDAARILVLSHDTASRA